MKKVVLLVCLLISAVWGGGFGKVSIATSGVDRSNILSADISDATADLSSLVLTLQDLPQVLQRRHLPLSKTQSAVSLTLNPQACLVITRTMTSSFKLSQDLQRNCPTGSIELNLMLKSVKRFLHNSSPNGLNSSSNKEFLFANLTALTLEDKIGEVSAGWTTQGNIKSVAMNVELALFRRGKIGSFMAIMYLDGSKPAVTISEAARQLDSHIMQLQPDLTQPQ